MAASSAAKEWQDLFKFKSKKRPAQASGPTSNKAKRATPPDSAVLAAPAVSPGQWNYLGNGGKLGFWPGALEPVCKQLFSGIADNTPWQHREVRIMGRAVMQPRLVAYMADGPHLAYTYSGLTLQPLEWSDEVLQIKQQVEQLADTRFNSCLLNFYRNGGDHMSWHSDNESLYGPTPIIASVSLGASRDFMIRAVADGTVKIKVPLSSGDVLVMAGTMQQHWQHSVPKRKGVAEPRLNLTFRNIITH